MGALAANPVVRSDHSDRSSAAGCRCIPCRVPVSRRRRGRAWIQRRVRVVQDACASLGRYIPDARGRQRGARGEAALSPRPGSSTRPTPTPSSARCSATGHRPKRTPLGPAAAHRGAQAAHRRGRGRRPLAPHARRARRVRGRPAPGLRARRRGRDPGSATPRRASSSFPPSSCCPRYDKLRPPARATLVS